MGTQLQDVALQFAVWKHLWYLLMKSLTFFVFFYFTGCNYGDVASGCSPSVCSVEANRPICCRTCGYSIPTTTTVSQATTTTTAAATGTTITPAPTSATTTVNSGILFSHAYLVKRTGNIQQIHVFLAKFSTDMQNT